MRRFADIRAPLENRQNKRHALKGRHKTVHERIRGGRETDREGHFTGGLSGRGVCSPSGVCSAAHCLSCPAFLRSGLAGGLVNKRRVWPPFLVLPESTREK